MEDKKISVIVPIYNKERHLEKCLNSLVNQTYNNIELILINDGSNDKSEMICEKIKQDKKYIKYIKIENSGVSVARNIGIEQATGDYIVFVDADDYVDKRYIESLCEGEFDLVVEGFCQDNQGDITKFNIENNILTKNEILNYLKNKSIANIFSVPYLKLFKKSIIKDNNIRFDTKLNFGEDFEFVLNYLMNIENKVCLKNYCYYFNIVEEGSLSRKEISNIWKQIEKILMTINKIYDNNKDRDYFLLRFVKIALLNVFCMKFSNFLKVYNDIQNSVFFKNANINNFVVFSVDWFIFICIKLNFKILTFIIFYIKRG